MDLSVVTVTWNSAQNIAEQITSVFLGCKNIACEQIIVDNNSSDKTVEIIKKISPNIKMIENKKNFGFGMANNQAVTLAQGEFILFLNPDMRVGEGILDQAVNWMRVHKETGIMGCKLLNKNGGFNLHSAPRRFPTLFDQLAIVFKFRFLFPKLLARYWFRDIDQNKEQEVDSVQGSFMLARRELIEKLGYAFDERYFIWFEDVDLCREAKKFGYKVVYNPTWTCVDYGGESFAKRNIWWKQKQFIKSMFKYFMKWGI